MRFAWRRAFTLVELLVVIAIIGVMVAMMIPAVQASREMGRRAMCTNHLAQLILAIQSYENAFEAFPAGVTNPDGPIRSEEVGDHHSWLVQLLPHLDEGPAYQAIDFSRSVYDSANARVRELSPDVFQCPSNPNSRPRVSDYAACHHDVESQIAADNHGVFFLNSHVRREDITDGASHTVFVAEKSTPLDDLGWMSGTRATLRDTGLQINAAAPAAAAKDVAYVGGFAGPHVYGMNVAFGDGSVKFVPEDIDLAVWQQLGHRADGKLLNISFDE